MKEFKISNLEEGQRFDKYLIKCMPNASKSFLYKMLRKKNITLNGKKADGNEKIVAGDVVKLFFSDETFDKFAMTQTDSKQSANIVTNSNVKLDITYEDDNIIIINKPSGMLSQKAKPQDISLIEHMHQYLIDSGYMTAANFKTFKPGICNRLDRNTSGLVVGGKTIKGLQDMTLAFKERTINKYYICIVKGKVDKRQRISGYLLKDEKTNKVTIYSAKDANIPKDALEIETEYIPIACNDTATLLKIHLITGRTHQIRAHLAYCNHPIAGDTKYGDSNFNKHFKTNYNIKDQMLHAFELNVPAKVMDILSSGLVVKTELPKDFLTVLKGEKLWAPGILEDLEAQH